MEELVGIKNRKTLMDFRDIHGQAQTINPATQKKQFTYRFGKYNHTYEYRKPFAPALFWNGSTLRHIVFPSREWIDLLCQTCSNIGDMPASDQDAFDKFVNDITYKYTIGVVRQAMRIKLLGLGINCYQPKVVQCMRYFDEYGAFKIFNPVDIVERFKLRESNTKRQQQLPDLGPKPKLELKDD